MSQSSNNDSLIEVLNYVSLQLERYVAAFIFIFGVVGNTLNICIFLQRPFRLNPCAWLFLSTSFIDLISILSGLITIIIGGWGFNPTNTIAWVCKLRAILVFSTRTMSPWLIVLATIDRWLLSSIDDEHRQKSTLKNAQRWTGFVIIISLLLYSQQIYCYEANLTDAPLQCYGKTTVCRHITDVSFALLTVLLPLLLMTFFGWLTISNMRKYQVQIQPSATYNHNCVVNNSSRPRMRMQEKSQSDEQIEVFFEFLLFKLYSLLYLPYH